MLEKIGFNLIMFSKSTSIHPILFAIFPILLIVTSNLDEVIEESTAEESD